MPAAVHKPFAYAGGMECDASCGCPVYAAAQIHRCVRMVSEGWDFLAVDACQLAAAGMQALVAVLPGLPRPCEACEAQSKV